jgi:hypothetical protein
VLMEYVVAMHQPIQYLGRVHDGEKLELSYIGGPGVWFTVVKASPTHIELTDDKGDTIHLMR